MTAAQGEYKDRLFNFIFGNEAHRDWTLSLYNAVNQTHYTDPSLIEFTTIRETLYLGMHNDVSFLIASLMNLYEQQSSFNPNMPVRLLQYAGNMYEQYIVNRKKNKYGRRLVQLPVPKLVVFYNGRDDKPAEMTLQLSDAFPEMFRDMSDIQVRVRMLNVNWGKNDSLLNACNPLSEYSWIVDRIRFNEETLKMSVEKEKLLEAAIDRTINEMPDHFVLKPYLEAHRAEVKGMLLTEYDEVKTMELFKEEGREEGREEGENKLAELMQKLFSVKRYQDAERASTDRAYRRKLYQEFQLS